MDERTGMPQVGMDATMVRDDGAGEVSRAAGSGSSRLRAGGLGLAVASAAAFATSGSFAGSLLREGWSPGAAVTARVVLGALLLSVPALRRLRSAPPLAPGAVRSVVVYGLVAVAGAQLCYFMAVQTLSVAVALLVEYSGVLLVVLWSWFREGRRPRRLTVTGALAAVAGLALVLDLAGASDLDPVGVLWALGAAVGLATYFVLSAGTDDAPPPLVSAWAGLAVGGAALLVAGALGVLPMTAPRVDVVLAGVETSWVVPVVGLALVAAALAYALGIAGARVLGATLASFVGLTEVLFAVVFAWLLLGQVLTGLQLVGGLLVLAGVSLVRLDDVRQDTTGGTPEQLSAVSAVSS